MAVAVRDCCRYALPCSIYNKFDYCYNHSRIYACSTSDSIIASWYQEDLFMNEIKYALKFLLYGFFYTASLLFLLVVLVPLAVVSCVVVLLLFVCTPFVDKDDVAELGEWFESFGKRTKREPFWVGLNRNYRRQKNG